MPRVVLRTLKKRAVCSLYMVCSEELATNEPITSDQD
ncbi:hypothetical protein Gorai_020136 [Gossypium raimondii]|uniref:Uncharacterized protein n=1 Tax=Gossypium raimondii TaxID=29730 RepID=A0A7J8PQ86_GOSRA|nr:hypothetical protein [Gossypium raimondii]